MTFSSGTFEQYFSSGRRLAILPGLVLAIGAAGVGALVAREPILAIGAVLGGILATAAVVWPNASTLVMFFILYTNFAVVAVKFHRVPFIFGAAVPLLLVFPLVNYLVFRRQKLIFRPLLVLLLLFLVIQMLGTVNAVRIDVAISKLLTFLTEGIGLYFLVTNVVRTSQLLRRVIWILLLAGTLLGGLTFYQQITQTFDDNYAGFAQVSNAGFKTGETKLLGEVEQPRLAGPIGEQNRYAQIMLMLVPLGLFRIWGEKSGWLRILAAVATAFISLGAALTFSRGAAVGFVLMVIIMIFLGYIKPFQILIIGAGLVLLLLAVPEYTTRLTRMEALTNLASQDGSGLAKADSSTKSRLTEMGAAGLAFFDHPFIGVGPGNFRYHYRYYAKQIGLRVLQSDRQAHSLFPSIAADTGGLGLITFIAILFVTLRDLARTRKRWLAYRPDFANLATGFLLAIVCYLTTGIFLHYGFVRFFWIIMALADAVNHVVANETQTRYGGMEPRSHTPSRLKLSYR